MKFKFLLIALFTFFAGLAQENATIKGTVTDRDMNNETLPFATVMVKGTKILATTDENGSYTLTVPAGTHTIVFSFLGYLDASVQVTVAAGETKTVDQQLHSDSVQLNDVIIEKVVNREKESTLLVEQQKAIEMKQAIGAQELTRKGVNDAAAAVIKTTGVSKQEGVNSVFVRGLGDRYNSTTLNGLPLPSENPLYKNISLDFFQSNIIKNININKTFSANLSGDNSGANIDITSKELESKALLSVQGGASINTSAISADNFQVADGAYSYFGFLKNGKDVPITDLNQYTFKSNFKTNTISSPVNTNFNITGGGKINVGEGNNTISFFGVASNITDYAYKKGFVGVATNTGDYQQRMNMDRYDYKTTQSLLGNVKFKHDKGSVSLNSLLIHNNNQFVGNYLGYNKDINDALGTDIAEQSLITRQQNNNNNLITNQLLGDYKFSDKISANAGVVYSTMRGSEPDRKTNTYAMTETGHYILGTNSYADNNRFFSTLDENDLGATAEVNYSVNPEANSPMIITLGGNYRKTDRTFNFTEFDYKQNGLTVDPNNPDLVLNQENFNSGAFSLITLRGGTNINPMYYIGNRKIGAGYAQFLYPVNEKLTIQVGLRDEQVKQTIIWDTNITSTVTDLTTPPSLIDKNYILPSANLKYSFNEKNALRFAASKTYTMPQFKEMANFLYTDVNFNERGNPYLKPSTVYNADIKYDYYLSQKEIISIGGFYKYIQDPILRMIMNTPGLDYSYVNTNKAYVAGAEIEARKTLYSVESDIRNKDLSFGLNASYLYSEQTQEDVTTGAVSASFTNRKGKMQGASPLLVNADLSYNTSTENTSLLSTLVFNYFYDKVYSVGTTGRENLVEKSVPTLDFINRFELKKTKMTISLGARNILNPKYRLTQEATSNVTGQTSDVLISSYRKGAVIMAGLSWQL
ncbi:TonB-dependent receptor [Flavobacterium album]|uniref:TonB-dependent receptor n=1 Tax=Flavobacterium album TaxID=2175091 RepID=A0A2S1QUJ9_9FLAO|nr:TonB-dependent receptor [Flavobacterium album]AWH84053.1 TonB-dependent receptor [Flavobacterium album]